MTTMVNTPPLPDKPSELIELALSDLEKIEQTQGYVVRMSAWHDPFWTEEDNDPVCAVCMAGAVMASTLGAMSKTELYPSDFDADTELKLSAINSFRVGHIHQGVTTMLGMRTPFKDREHTPYADDHKRFKQEMRQLIEDFRSHGL